MVQRLVTEWRTFNVQAMGIRRMPTALNRDLKGNKPTWLTVIKTAEVLQLWGSAPTCICRRNIGIKKELIQGLPGVF